MDDLQRNPRVRYHRFLDVQAPQGQRYSYVFSVSPGLMNVNVVHKRPTHIRNCVTPPNSNHTPTQNSDPELRTPNRTATPTGPRTDRTASYTWPQPIGTLPADTIATTTEAVDRTGQPGRTTE